MTPDFDEVALIGKLLNAVPAMREPGQPRKLTDLIGRLLPGPGEVDAQSGWDVSDWLSQVKRGFETLYKVVETREDWFPPENTAVRALAAELAKVCGKPAREQFVQRRMPLEREMRDLFAWVIPPDRMLLHAYQLAAPDAVVPVDLTGEGCIAALLGHADQVVDNAAMYVLRFLATVEHQLRHVEEDKEGADRVHTACELLVREAPELQPDLDSAQDRATEFSDRLRSARLHLLFRVTPAADDDPESPAASRQYELTAWRYTDSEYPRRPPSSEIFATRLFRDDAVGGAELPSRVAEAVAEFEKEPDLVVELMKQCAQLDDGAELWPYGRHRVPLGSKFALVLRPWDVRVDDISKWYGNWGLVLANGGGEFEVLDGRAPAWERVAGSRAVALAGGVRDRVGAVSTLVASGVPVVAWRRDGNPVGKLTKKLSFTTPITLRRQRSRPNGDCQDVVLVWHNPHWVPQDYELCWQNGVMG